MKTPMTEAQFLTEAHVGSGGDEFAMEEALVAFLRSHGFEDMARHIDGMCQDAREDGRSHGREEARDRAFEELEYFTGKLRSALGRGDVDAAKTLIDIQLGVDEDGHQLSIGEVADRKAKVE